MGETNGIRMRVRNRTRGHVGDDWQYNSKVSWVNGSFTGGNTRYSPSGFRLYALGGWIRLEENGRGYAQFHISKIANAQGSYITFKNTINSSVTFSHDANARRLCFTTRFNTGCVSYNIAFEVIP